MPELPETLADQMPFERTDVEVDGVRVNVFDDGPREAEETLLFLHGNPTWSFLWRNLMLPARQAGHRVVAPDMVGLGLSEKPLSPAYHSLQRHVLNLRGVMQALDLEDVTVVMHDWGGPIGMGMAASEPERIARLVVANTLAFPPRSQRSLSQWHRFFSSGIGQALSKRFNLVARSALRMGVAEPLPDPVRRAYLWPLREEGAQVAVNRLVEMVPDGPDHPTARTLTEIQEGYAGLADTPMLVLWADRDPVMRPKFASKWSDAFPQAEVKHVSETAKHFWQEDDPGPFLREILAFVGGGKDK